MFYRPPPEWEEEEIYSLFSSGSFEVNYTSLRKEAILMFLFWQTSNKIYFKLFILKSKQTIGQPNSLFSSGTFEVHRSPLIIHYKVKIDDWRCIITAIGCHYITEQGRTIEYIGSVDYLFIIDASHRLSRFNTRNVDDKHICIYIYIYLYSSQEKERLFVVLTASCVCNHQP